MGTPHELSPTDIADWTLVSTGAVTKRVDRCLEQGWVTRRSAQQDGRGRVIALTPKGREVAEAVYATHIRTLHELLEPLDEAERTGMAAVLEKWGRALGA
jgi:DNA-binding MarR family transcriptional regulator